MKRRRFKFWLGVLVFIGTLGFASNIFGAILVTIVYSFVFDEFYKHA